jgi:hypothetical protein
LTIKKSAYASHSWSKQADSRGISPRIKSADKYYVMGIYFLL